MNNTWFSNVLILVWCIRVERLSQVVLLQTIYKTYFIFCRLTSLIRCIYFCDCWPLYVINEQFICNDRFHIKTVINDKIIVAIIIHGGSDDYVSHLPWGSSLLSTEY